MALSSSETPAKLSPFLAELVSAQTVEITQFSKLGGGAIQENWRLDFTADTADAGTKQFQWVLRTDSPSGLLASWSKAQEYAILDVAHRHDVLVPKPVIYCAAPSPIGPEFYLMERRAGEARGPKLVKDPAIAAGGDDLVAQLGGQLARIHRIGADAAALAFIDRPSVHPALARIEELRRYLISQAEPQPVIELALCWMADNLPPSSRLCLNHGDLRTGNFLVDDGRLSAILDWEFATFSDPLDDIGWMLARCWRFGVFQREAGGLGSAEGFLRAYETESRTIIDRDQIPYWQLLATVRWAVIALEQAARAYEQGEASLELALTAEVVPALEWDILDALDALSGQAPEVADRPPPNAAVSGEARSPDVAKTMALLRLAEHSLNETVRPNLAGHAKFVASMVARSIQITTQRLELAPQHQGRLEADLVELLPSSTASNSRDLQVDLVKRLRDGRHDAAWFGQLRQTMRGWVGDRLAISDPTYVERLRAGGQ